MTVYRLTNELVFPDPEEADPSGILAVGGDLSVQRLLEAYASGIFPWFDNDEEILWWSPDPRFVLFPAEFHKPKSLEKRCKKGCYRVTADLAFDNVINSCSMKRKVQGKEVTRTWITEGMRKAYLELHALGYAHSLETWEGNSLVGGLYGVSLGKIFFGESMFTRKSDASKVALAALVDFCLARDFVLIDSQVPTEHLAKLGARPIPRAQYLSELAKALKHETLRGSWSGYFPAREDHAEKGR
jgi:leucyl/phenylalanyl-tRNA--protein transferase